jgi:hypothetical protein
VEAILRFSAHAEFIIHHVNEHGEMMGNINSNKMASKLTESTTSFITDEIISSLISNSPPYLIGEREIEHGSGE